MNCKCCGKPLKIDNEYGWHKSCIRKFFGTSSLPKIDIDDDLLEQLAVESTNRGLTVPGVQKKISLHLLSDNNQPRLTLVNYPSGYILKPQVPEFESLPQAEHLVMCMADASGICTVPHALVGGEHPAYITKRIDRIFDKSGVHMLAMEDFCQLDLRLTRDKYKSSYERCAKIIARYSSQSMLDMTELYLRLVFCFVTGNSDMHLKNFSLVEKTPGGCEYKLSPAYDLLPVNLIMPEDTEEIALTLNGKKKKLRKKDFLIFAESCGISRVVAERIIGKIISLKDVYDDLCNNSYLPEHLKSEFLELIDTRIQTLETE